MIEAALTILALPLAAFIVQIFFGRRLPRGGDWVSVGAIFLTIPFSLYILFRLIQSGDPSFRIDLTWPWIEAGDFRISLGIGLDNLAGVMLVVVTVVSALVHLFSIGYMEGDPLYSRYFAYLSLFSFSMLGLTLANNLLILYIFWELVGLCSYLLIGHWFTRPAAASAAKKAFIVTRTGDVGMFIGVMAIFAITGSGDYTQAFSAVADGRIAGLTLTFVGLALFAGAVGKSAQFPLHVWLPDAMEGPTPVSALIHAATMVAAGVYMVARLYPLFSFDALLLIAYVGAFTALFSATIAITARDIKRVMAYSTISQLGYMMLGLGVGGYTAGVFHLWTHAYFKALLFLCAGSIIHALHTQDMWQLGGLRKKMPLTFITFVSAALAISGFPLSSGFYSKDAILGAALDFSLENPGHFLPFLLGMITVAVTAFYVFKMLFVAFFGEPRDHHAYQHAHDSPLVMAIPLITLGILSLSSGWGGWFSELVRLPTSNPSQGGGGQAHQLVLILSLIMLFLGAGLAFLIYLKGVVSPHILAERFRRLYLLLYNKYYMDEIYNRVVVGTVLLFNRITRWLDDNIIDGGVNGVAYLGWLWAKFEGLFDDLVVDGAVKGTANTILINGAILQRVQTGKLQNYLTLVLIGIFIIFLLAVL